MTSNENNADNLKIHVKQLLNKLNHAYELFKKIENQEKDKPAQLSKHNNLNLLCGLVADILGNDNPSNF